MTIDGGRGCVEWCTLPWRMEGEGNAPVYGRRIGDWPFSEGKNGHFSPKNGQFFCFLPYLLTKFPKNCQNGFLAYFFENLAVFLLFGIFCLGNFFVRGGQRGEKLTF